VKYATRHLRLHPGALGGEKFVAIGAEPDRPTGFVLVAEGPPSGRAVSSTCGHAGVGDMLVSSAI
jgi:hypothetical protein